MCMLYVFIYLSTYLPTYLVRVLVDSLYISIPNPLFGVDYWIRWPATISAHVMSHLPAIFEPQPSRKTCHGPVMAQSWPSISSHFCIQHHPTWSFQSFHSWILRPFGDDFPIKTIDSMSFQLHWLVVYLPLWKMMEWKSDWIIIPTIGENNPNLPNHQPVQISSGKGRLRGHFEVENPSAARSCGHRPEASASEKYIPHWDLVIVIDINDTPRILCRYMNLYSIYVPIVYLYSIYVIVYDNYYYIDIWFIWYTNNSASNTPRMLDISWSTGICSWKWFISAAGAWEPGRDWHRSDGSSQCHPCCSLKLQIAMLIHVGLCWLVVSTPLKNIKVNIWKNKKCSKPPTSMGLWRNSLRVGSCWPCLGTEMTWGCCNFVSLTTIHPVGNPLKSQNEFQGNCALQAS